MYRSVLLVLFGIACLAAAPAPKHLRAGDPLEGDWKATLTPSGADANQPGVREFDDTLTFTPTKFSSKYMSNHGFKPSDYDEDSRMFGPAKFTSKQDSDKEGKLEWQGVVDANEITGTLKWTKKDGTVIHYDIQGSRAGT